MRTLHTNYLSAFVAYLMSGKSSSKRLHVLYSVAYVVALTFGYATLSAQPGYYNQQQQQAPEESASPRFFLQGGDVSKFPLASTDVSVTVVGVIADVTVKQVYRNEGTEPIEAVYVFPASRRAAVYGMTMKVADRIIRALVKEKEQARVEYNQAKAEGKSASLLEELRPNVFKMNVANIMPGDSITVELKYTESIELNDGIYSFHYPAVVGPRYIGNATRDEVVQALSTSQATSREMPGTFSFKANISAGVPVRFVESPSHQITTSIIDSKSKKTLASAAPNSTTVVEAAATRNNVDVVLRYALMGAKIESGLLLYQGKTENYFMLMVQPPKNVLVPQIVKREYVFIIDVSGSMWGYPLDVTKRLMNNLFEKLRPTDKFNVMLFSGGQKVYAPTSVFATKENIEDVKNFMNSGYGGGGTELLPALKQALAMQADSTMSRSFVVVTDGYVTVEKEAMDLIRDNLNKANLFSVGIGNSVNRYIIDGMAKAGHGDPFVILNPKDADNQSQKILDYISAPVLTKLKVNYGDMEVYDVQPKAIPDVTSKRPIVIFGKWKGKAEGMVKLTGYSGDGEFDFSMNIKQSPASPENSALQYMWAKSKILELQDEIQYRGDGAVKQQITQLGLQYNLLTPYTSFIAVDSVVRVVKSNAAIVKPLLQDTVVEKYQRTKEVAKPAIDGNLKTEESAIALDSSINTYYWSLPKQGFSTSGTYQKSKPAPATKDGAASGAKRDKQLKRVERKSSTREEAASGDDAIEDVKVSNNAPAQIPQIAPKQQAVEVEAKKLPTVASAPVSNTTQTQAAVVTPSGGVSVRGSRASDTQVRVDATETTDRVQSAPIEPAPARSAITLNLSTSAAEDDNEDDPCFPARRPPKNYVGFYAAYNSIVPKEFTQVSLNASTPLTLTREQSNGYSIGLQHEYILGDPARSKSSLTSTLFFTRSYVRHTATDSASVLSGSVLRNALAQYKIENSQSTLTLIPQFRFRIGNTPFYLSAGAALSVHLASEYSYSVSASDSLAPIAGMQYSNNNTTATLLQNPQATASAYNVGVVASVGYQLNVFKKWTVAPEFLVQYDILKTAKENGYVPLSFRFGLAVTFAL